MLNKKTIALAAATLTTFVSLSSAAVYINENFGYADGQLNGKDPAVGGAWANHSGTAGQIQVAGGKATLVQGTQSEDINSAFEGGFVLGAGGSLYAAFDMTIADPGAAITPVYFASFLTGTTLFDARVWVTTPTTSGYRLAISNDNSISDADGEVFTGDLAFGTTYRIVTKYNFDAKSGQLWINPSSEASASILATDPGFSDAAIAYAFREAAGNTQQVLDNLIVASTFAETAVPEPTTLGLLAGMGVLALRRRSAR